MQWFERAPSPADLPPPGKFTPIRGFGKIWSEHPELRDALGWAVEYERAKRGVIQIFTTGSAIVWLQSSNFVYIFGPNGQTTAAPLITAN